MRRLLNFEIGKNTTVFCVVSKGALMEKGGGVRKIERKLISKHGGVEAFLQLACIHICN